MVLKVLQKIYYLLNYFRLSFFKLRYSIYKISYDLSKSFKFNGVDIEMYGSGKIIIGENSYIGNRSVIYSATNQIVKIGNNVSISHNVRIYTKNRNPKFILGDANAVSYIQGDVEIGDNSWIGANVFINQGVKIGKNVIIGANAVVTKSFSDNLIIGGVPAKIISPIE